MYYNKPSEIYNIEYYRLVINSFDSLLRHAERYEFRDLPIIRKQIEDSIKTWNEKIIDEVESLVTKKRETSELRLRIFQS